MVVEQVDHDPGKAPPVSADPVAARDHHRMGIGETVDPAVQGDRPLHFLAIL